MKKAPLIRLRNGIASQAYARMSKSIGIASGIEPSIGDVIDPVLEVQGFPSGLAYLQVGTEITLTWNDGSTNEDAILIERSTNGESFVGVNVVAANTTSYVDDVTGIEAENIYYRVTAIKGHFGKKSGVLLGANLNPLIIINDAYWAAKQSAILATQSANLLMYLPLTETSGTIATNIAPAKSNVNILYNPGFELAGDGTYPTALRWGQSLSGGTATRVLDITHSGTAALKLQSTGGYTMLSQTISVKEGQSYTFKCWSRGDGTTSPRVRILRGDSGTYLVNALTANTTTNWAQYTVTFTPPVGYSSRIYLQITTNNVNGSIAWFDDCELYSNTAFSDVFNGTYINPVLDSDSGEGKALYFDGNGAVNLSTPEIANTFPTVAPEGTMLIFGKMTDTVLNDAVIRYLVKFKTSANPTANYIDCFKTATAKTVGCQYQDDGDQGYFRVTSGLSDQWFSLGVRWSVANGISFSFNGEQYSNAAITGNWTDQFDFNILALASSTSLGYENNWKGYIKNFCLWNKELTEAEMLTLGRLK